MSCPCRLARHTECEFLRKPLKQNMQNAPCHKATLNSQFHRCLVALRGFLAQRDAKQLLHKHMVAASHLPVTLHLVKSWSDRTPLPAARSFATALALRTPMDGILACARATSITT